MVHSLHLNKDQIVFYVIQFLRSFLLLNVIITILFDKMSFGTVNAFTFLAFTNLFFVLLEYPTGVIGDLFGHKVSIMTGHLVMATGLSIIAFSNILEIYYFGIFIYAIGHTLNSGSDIALLKNITNNYAKSLGFFKGITLTSIALAGFIGPYLFTVNYLIPFYIQICFLLLCFIFSFFLSSKTNFIKADITTKFLIQKSLKFAFTKICNISLLINSSLSWSFLTSLKFITTLYFLIYGLSESTVGFFYSTVLLVDVVTSFIYTRLISRIKLLILCLIIVSSCLVFWINNLFIHFGFMIITVFLLSVISCYFSYEFLKSVPDDIRASVSSLQSLTSRLINSLVIFSAGFIGVSIKNLAIFYSIALFLICFMGLTHFYFSQKRNSTN